MSIYASAPVSRSAGDYIDVTRWNAEIYTKLTEIDALFNAVTGHDHSGADEGKPIIAAGIAADAVITTKIKDANVTAAKLATDAVETAKIANDAITNAKLARQIFVQAGAPVAGATGDIWIDT